MTGLSYYQSDQSDMFAQERRAVRAVARSLYIK